MAKVRVIGVPMDLGGGRRGVDMGPSALRNARLIPCLQALGHVVIDSGDLRVPAPERARPGPAKAKYLTAIRGTCERLARQVHAAVSQGELPLVLGGDHSIAVGTIAGLTRYYPRLGVVWLDAHGDLNTPETTPSGNVHGMPLAASLGRGPRALTRCGGFAPKLTPERTALIGVRSLDAGERLTVQALGLAVHSMHDIDRRGLARTIELALGQLCQAGVEALHISLDIDVLDPAVAPGVGTPERGGLTYREGHLAMEMLAETGLVVSLEVVEVNPILDRENATAEIAVELTASALGARIV